MRDKRIVASVMAAALFLSLFLVAFSNGVAAAEPSSVVLVGDLQSKLGANDWQADSAVTRMIPIGDELYLFSGMLPKNQQGYQFKVVVNGNQYYGVNGVLNGYGDNYTLSVNEPARVSFIFDNKTKLTFTDRTVAANSRTATVTGSMQTQLGAASNWSATEQATRMQYLGAGIYILRATLNEGTYEYKVAMNGSWNENYGAGGAAGGANISFTLSARQDVVFVFQDSANGRKVTEWFDGKLTASMPTTTWRDLDNSYYYEGNDLGAAYYDGAALLKLWAPKASSVKVNFYDKHDSSTFKGSLLLTKGRQGVWSALATPSLLGVSDLLGYYYQYEITNNGQTKKVLDPYARSLAEFRVSTTGAAGPDQDTVGKAAIVKPGETNPPGFDFAHIAGYEQREDAIIYEIHVRDFTSDPAVESDLHSRWGTYTAFIDKLPYIQSLGVTHIQLLPVMAWYYGDEAAMGSREMNYSTLHNNYSWGYDPHSFFAPDGAYSVNPRDPELRIREMKQLIHAIHQAGMGVILDVVYTHTANTAILEDIVPGYYYFQKANGEFVGEFGNNLATNRKMAEKLMLDSVKYWFSEYKIDGMRFDMMGDATYPAIQNAYNAAAAINPKAIFLGEGWRTFSGYQSDPELLGYGADQDWMNKTNDVGVFSDELRNELKSGFGAEGEARFVTGGERNINRIFANIKAQPSNTPADDPGDMVNYVEAHDNLTLHDSIAKTIRKHPDDASNQLEIQRRIRLANTLLLTSQGTAFIHAGQEYGRTKQWRGADMPANNYDTITDYNNNFLAHIINNSYDSSDAINRFDWSKATNRAQYPEHTRTVDYTAGLIKLRKSTNAFRLGNQSLVNEKVSLIQAPEIKENDLVIAYKSQSTDDMGTYYVFVNADSQARTLSLSENLLYGQVLVDQDEAGIREVSSRNGFLLTANYIQLQPLTTVIIKKGGKITEPVRIELENGGFEAGNLQSWTEWHPAGQLTAYGVDSNDVRSGYYKLWFWRAEPYQQSVHKVLNGLDNGSYRVNAWIKQSSENPSVARMELSGHGGASVYVNTSPGNQYTQYTANITVTTGMLDIGFYINDAIGGANMQIDDVELIRTE